MSVRSTATMHDQTNDNVTKKERKSVPTSFPPWCTLVRARSDRFPRVHFIAKSQTSSRGKNRPRQHIQSRYTFSQWWVKRQPLNGKMSPAHALSNVANGKCPVKTSSVELSVEHAPRNDLAPAVFAACWCLICKATPYGYRSRSGSVQFRGANHNCFLSPEVCVQHKQAKVKAQVAQGNLMAQ